MPVVRKYAGKTVPDKSVPDKSVPDKSVPDESVPDESVPDESVPDESVPDKSVPDKSVPDESMPDESMPDKSVPDKSCAGLNCWFCSLATSVYYVVLKFNYNWLLTSIAVGVSYFSCWFGLLRQFQSVAICWKWMTSELVACDSSPVCCCAAWKVNIRRYCLPTSVIRSCLVRQFFSEYCCLCQCIGTVWFTSVRRCCLSLS